MKKITFYLILFLLVLFSIFYQRFITHRQTTKLNTKQKAFVLQEWNGETMGTTYSIKVYAPVNYLTNHSIKILKDLDKDMSLLKKKIKKRLRQINQKMSTYDPNSEISKLNIYPAHSPFQTSRELFDLIHYANHFSEISDGYYDITIGYLVEHWGFGRDSDLKTSNDISFTSNLSNTDLSNGDISSLFKKVLRHDIATPRLSEIMDFKKKVGYQFLDLNSQNYHITKNSDNLNIDLSSIAKGYAVDEISKLLNEYALTNHLVEIGGEITVNGYKYQKENARRKSESNTWIPWQIGIHYPSFNSQELEKTIKLNYSRSSNTSKSSLKNQINSVATSGDYQNFIYLEGQKYSHILDSKTGAPTTNNVTSLTVLSTNCTTADALATMLIAMPLKESLKLAEKEKLLAYYLYYQEGKLVKKMTTELKNYLARRR